MRLKLLTIITIAILFFSCSEKRDYLPKQEYLYWYLNDSAQLGDWSPAVVPGSIYQTLFSNDFLSESRIYLDHLIDKSSWLTEKKVWIYKAKFKYTAPLTDREKVEFVLNGVDTYAEIYVNNQYVGKTTNYFLSYRFDITKYLKKNANNEIVVKFIPARRKAQTLYNNLNYPVPDGWYSIVRKPLFHYQHKYSINYNPTGFYKSPYLLFWSKARITDFQVYQKSLTKEKAELLIKLKIYSVKNQTAKITISTQYQDLISKKLKLFAGENQFSFNVTIKNPKLWYPKNYGEQHLYKFKANLYVKNLRVSNVEYTYGLRKIKIDTTNNNFKLYINDIPIDLKIAEIFPTSVEYQTTFKQSSKLLKLIENANFNAIITSDYSFYFPKRFFELTDKNGILVIFTFAYPIKILPPQDTVAKIYISETQHTLNMFHNHPSIIAWHSNFDINKIQSKLKNYPKEQKQELLNFSNLLFKEIIPKLIIDYDNNERPYLTNLNFKNLYLCQDTAVSLPVYKDLAKIKYYKISIIKDQDLLKYYTKPNPRYYNQILNLYKNFKIDSLEVVQYLSNLNHRNEIEKLIQTVLLNPNYNHILCPWFNDISLAISPSAVYTVNFPKAKYFALVDDLKPFAIYTKNIAPNNLEVTIISELDTAQILAYFKLYDLKGRLLWQKILQDTIINHKVIRTFDLGMYFKLFGKDTILFKTEVYHNLELMAEKYHYFVPIEKLKLQDPQLEYNVQQIENGFALEISAKNFLAKDVFINVKHPSLTISDNFFDLLPGENKIIIIETRLKIRDIEPLISIFSYYDFITGKYYEKIQSKLIFKTSTKPNQFFLQQFNR